MCVIVVRGAQRKEMGSTSEGNRWRVRRGLLVAVRLKGLAGLSVAGYFVRDVEPFLDRFPGRVDMCVG